MKVVIDLSLLGSLRWPEPEIEGVHESEQVSDPSVGNLSELEKGGADVGLFQQLQQ